MTELLAEVIRMQLHRRDQPRRLWDDGFHASQVGHALWIVPRAEFTVDGIRYCVWENDTYRRRMIDLYEDDVDPNGAAWMECSRPPTESELDAWVRHGGRHGL